MRGYLLGPPLVQYYALGKFIISVCNTMPAPRPFISKEDFSKTLIFQLIKRKDRAEHNPPSDPSITITLGYTADCVDDGEPFSSKTAIFFL